MPTQTVIDPFINPVSFFDEDPDTDERFNSKDFIDWAFEDTILPWEEPVCWKQFWQTSDTIHLQLQSTYTPISIQVRDADTGAVVNTIPYSVIIPNADNPDLRILECDIDLSVYPEGNYYLRRLFGSPVVLAQRSNIFELSEIHENTVLLEAKHYKEREDAIFQTGFFPSLRVKGTKKLDKLGSNDTIYEDQPGNREVLRSDNFRVWRLGIGGSEGIPDEIADKISRMLGCSYFLIDGKYYVKAEGANLEPNTVENYPMKGWSIDLREKLNRASKHYEQVTASNAQVSVIIAVDTRGFAEGNTGSVTTIEDVQ
jgi:hypothetical protein